jgi:hypothetical protein
MTVIVLMVILAAALVATYVIQTSTPVPAGSPTPS